MTEDQARAAADLLFEHRREGRRLPALAEALRPATRAEGYAIQALFVEDRAHRLDDPACLRGLLRREPRHSATGKGRL